MNDSLVPETLDIRKAFTGDTVIEGDWPVRRMSRLMGSLNNDEGVAHVRLEFSRDAQWRRVISGEVTVTVQVSCERCLHSFALSLKEPVRLAVVESEGLAERLPEEIDPWLTDEDTLSVPDIIEDQLILAMPIVARHSEDCMPDEQKQALQRAASELGDDNGGRNKSTEGAAGDNPFAILETLKKTDR